MKNIFLTNLLLEIKNGIPGENSHLKMLPSNRTLSSYSLKATSQTKESAVAVILFPIENSIKCILIQRPEYEGNHSGQIAFPGGKKDPSDLHLEYTARRETYEEIGIPISVGLFIGELTQVYIPVSNFLVQPIIYFHEEIPLLIPDEREVAEIFTFSIDELLNENCFSSMKVKFTTSMSQKNVPCFQLGEKQIWGATALILNELRDLLLRF